MLETMLESSECKHLYKAKMIQLEQFITFVCLKFEVSLKLKLVTINETANQCLEKVKEYGEQSGTLDSWRDSYPKLYEVMENMTVNECRLMFVQLLTVNIPDSYPHPLHTLSPSITSLASSALCHDPVFCHCSFQFGFYICLNYVFILILLVIKFFLPICFPPMPNLHFYVISRV